MADMAQAAAQAIEKPEVQEMIKKLAEYGLGVFMPHMHDEQGRFAPLPRDVVAVESGLVVSFHSKEDPVAQQARPVGWVWDNETKTVQACFECYEVGGRHGKQRHAGT